MFAAGSVKYSVAQLSTAIVVQRETAHTAVLLVSLCESA